MSTAVTKKPETSQTPARLRDWLEAPTVRAGVNSALAGYMDVDSFIAQMLIAFQDDNLIDCTPQSKFEAVHQCAALQLLPSLKQVALIPRDIKNRGKCVSVMPQWQGYQALMLRHPNVLSIKAVLVHVNDSYTYDPVNESLQHSFDPFDSDRKFASVADIRGGYLVVKWKDSQPPLYHFVTADTIRKARDCAQSKNIWDKWFFEQALKTIYRNAYARRVVPIDPLLQSRLQGLVEADDVALENDPSRVIDVPSPAAITHKPSRTEQAAKRVAKPQERPEPEPDPQPEQEKPPASFQDQIVAAGSVMELEQIKKQYEAAEISKEEREMLNSFRKQRIQELAAG